MSDLRCDVDNLQSAESRLQMSSSDNVASSSARSLAATDLHMVIAANERLVRQNTELTNEVARLREEAGDLKMVVSKLEIETGRKEARCEKVHGQILQPMSDGLRDTTASEPQLGGRLRT